MIPVASQSTTFTKKGPMAVVECKMHKTTQARGSFKIRNIVQLAAYNDGVARRMAV